MAPLGVSLLQCDNGQGNGACRAGFEHALETTNPPELRNRLFQNTYGGAFAAQRVTCDKTHCSAQCF